ncbi:MAG TPA: hypothetical protein VLG44_01835, partial [Chlamydiales bacterium]|nr:hypothetical protein [Chlamydiales bacterium]
MKIHFEETKTARVGDVECKTPPPDRVSLATARDSLETMASPGAGFIGRANILFNYFEKAILGAVNVFLAAIGIKQKPPKNTETELSNETRRKLDELIIDLRANDKDALHIFSKIHSKEVLSLLLDCEPSFTGLRDPNGNTVLHVCKDRPTAKLLLEADPTLVFARNKHYESPIDTTPAALEMYLTQFAETHSDLGPKDFNKSLEIAIGKAIHADLREPGEASMTLERDRILIKSDRGIPIGETFETLETARILIEAGADVSTQVKFGVNGTQSVLDCI